MNLKVVIMAGGKGTRIATINSDVPKPMIPILNKPILEYQIETLKKQGFTDIILVAGHLGTVIKNYFGNGSGISPATGEPFGVNIDYLMEEQPLGTAGALYLLKNKLSEDFLLLNGDIIFDVDIERFYKFHMKHGGLATLLTHPNGHPYDSGIIIADSNDKVTNWLHNDENKLWYRNRVNAGIHIFSKRIFDNTLGLFQKLKRLDLDRDVLKPLIPSGQLVVYDSPEYVKDMGTPDRFYSVAEDIKKGKVEAKNIKNRQKAIFMDRDGTINKYIGFLRNIDQFELLPGVAEAIKKINESGYLAIVVSNQPVVARGEVTFDELQNIHNKMETLLGQSGAYLDAIYFCPHHPHSGYKSEVQELKIDCSCRKPKPGMLLEAAENFNIEIEKSWMVGDSETDVQAGQNAGCKVALVENLINIHTVPHYKSLLDFVKTEICNMAV